jgi:lipopolysaccharide biosynthesis glycosyltransferase
MLGDNVTAPTHAATRAALDRDPIVVLAADDNFAMPLAATVRSALDNLAPDRKLRIYVLDGGIKDVTKQRLLQSWPEARYSIEWLKVDETALAGLPISGHINVISYYRVLIPRVLPLDVHRVIYLDADLIVRTDLAQLWDHDLSGRLCLAAQDCAAPYLDSSQALANYPLCVPHLGAAKPIRNFRELGLEPQGAYFNAGVLLIDLAAWRNVDLSTQLLVCLKQHRQHVLWWDQYALNVVLANRWGMLDARWNQGSHVYAYPTWEQSPFDRQTYVQLREDPYIVHFTSRAKPWQPLCRHPFRGAYFTYINRTAWADWHPPRLEVALAVGKTLERRLRLGRNWLRTRARQWMQRGGDRFSH